ncbi:MAG: carboxylesterase/lipase family protein [Myxococcota bacterium]
MRVKTEAGELVGREEGVAIFRGIPYAAPPVGPLRLRPPEPHPGWRGCRDATRSAAAPPQRSDPLSDALGLLHGCPVDEDCLLLNVFTPAADDAGRPVLVWLPGGAFMGGAASAPLYDGRHLAARGDVVVVTVGYRVGALGFSAREDPFASNLGLQDQLAALRWVRRNVAAFGGDPGRVTVFGESAGAGSLLALAGMPAAEGLFRRAIVQSAAPRGVLGWEEALERTARVEARLAPHTLADAGVEALLDAQYACAADGFHRTGMFYAPVLDGRTLTVPPWEAFARGWARDVDLLIGTTRDEMRLYTTGAPDSDDVVAMIVAAQLAGSPDDRDARARELVEAFRAARRERGEPTTPCDLNHALQTELSLRLDATRLAEARGPNTFMYLFGWESPWQDGAVRACHAVDLPFVFGTLDAPGMSAFAGSGEAAEALSGKVMDAWCAFARDGSPAHPTLGDWPAYDRERRATFELGARCVLREAPLEAERAAMDRLRGE